MGEAQLSEVMYRVIGVLEGGDRRVWRYRSKPDAQWRARELNEHPECELIEFSVASIRWKPADWEDSR